jgi:hypothetical protein
MVMATTAATTAETPTMTTLSGCIWCVVPLAITPSRSSTHLSTNVSRPWRRWGDAWRIWTVWSKTTTSSWIATCANVLAWSGTWEASGAIVAESTTRFSFPLRIFVRYDEDVVWF